MELILGIIAVVALIIAINCNTEIKRLKHENNYLKNMMQKIMSKLDGEDDWASGFDEATPRPQQHLQQNLQQQMQRPVQQPVIQRPVQQRPVMQSKPPKENSNFENVFGKNVIGIVATILIFIGVIAFGTLVFSQLTDAIKVIGMFLASFATVGAGLFITKKNKSAFSEILTGCGMGMTYISIFISHLYFGIISDIFTFVLIFLWSIAVSFISKKFTIKSLSYIALAGCVISSIFSLGYGFASQKFVEITIYHIITFVLLIIANKEDKLLFKLSSLASVILNTILASIIAMYVDVGNVMGDIQTLLPVEAPNKGLLVLCLLLAVYNVAIYIYSSRETLANKIGDSIISTIIHYISVTFAFCVPVAAIIDSVILRNAVGYSPLFPILFIPAVFVFTLVSLRAYNMLVRDEEKKLYPVILTELFLAFILLSAPFEFANNTITTLLLFPILNLIAYQKLKHTDIKSANAMYWTGFGLLLFDCISSLFFLFEFGAFGMLYSGVLIAISFMYFKVKYDNPLHFPFMQSALLNIHFLLTGLSFIDGLQNGNPNIILVPLVLMNILYSGYCSFSGINANKISNILMEVGESLLIFILSIVAIFMKESFPLSTFILSTSLILLALIRIKAVIERKNAFMSVWYGIKFTYFIFMTTELFVHLSNQQFILSVFFMLVACVCIVFGFMKELKALRIYGLALIMTSVFKMVVIDVWNQNSLVRVASLIIGGIICFAISAAYSKIEKKQQNLIDE